VALPARAADRPGSSDALWAVAGRPAAPASGLLAAGESRAAGVVGIMADEGAGSGVYVRDDLVLTTATLVARSSVIEVVAADGAHVLGLVARTDRGRNLALVQVAKPGAPVALHDGPPLAAGRPIEALLQHGAGRPTLATGRYVGAGPAASVALAAFTGVVYIDAPALQDQPEATPWFLGDALVALGIGAAAERADGPLGAIGAAEIGDFLYGAGGALAALP
jgi:S1-C subfamily serine protease